MVAVPMIVKDEAIGVINVYTKQPHHFEDGEINVLQIVANQAAVAVENCGHAAHGGSSSWMITCWRIALPFAI